MLTISLKTEVGNHHTSEPMGNQIASDSEKECRLDLPHSWKLSLGQKYQFTLLRAEIKNNCLKTPKSFVK